LLYCFEKIENPKKLKNQEKYKKICMFVILVCFSAFRQVLPMLVFVSLALSLHDFLTHEKGLKKLKII